jgi:hypothetical protein
MICSPYTLLIQYLDLTLLTVRKFTELVDSVLQLFRETKTEIKTFGAGFQLNPDQLKMRDNIQSLLAGKLSDLSMIFRKQQKDYLESA